ncbi:MAG: response regulator transcription factor [Burkholderiales bacterium]|jgi:DNA-binding response OmpR family regulator|nr:response regulator transcription factor [Burkholderiales bacterium]
MIQPYDILIVEDNYSLRESLRDFLMDSGFSVRCVDDGEEMNVALAKKVCHVLVLDLNLPFEDGISISKRVRRAYPEIRILILTARVQHADRVDSYESGADVYLTKPVAPGELKTVLLNLCRRFHLEESLECWKFEPLLFCLTSPEHQKIHLTATETALFHELVLAEHAVPLYRLIQRVGNIDFPEEVNKVRIEKLISRLRHKIKPSGKDDLVIKSIYKTGYQLMLQVVVA